MYERRRLGIMDQFRPYPTIGFTTEEVKDEPMFTPHSPVLQHSPGFEAAPTLMDLMELEISTFKEDPDVTDARTELLRLMDALKREYPRSPSIDFLPTVVSPPNTPPYRETAPYHTQSENKVRLYEFVLELLKGDQHDCIRWLSQKEGEFEITNSSKIAALWGQVKRNPNMTYEKFARALRHYYKLGILVNYKHKEKLRYKFTKEVLLKHNIPASQ